MDPDFEQSLDAHSEFVSLDSPLDNPLGESLVATSEKIFFANASVVNREEFERDKQHLPEQKIHNKKAEKVENKD